MPRDIAKRVLVELTNELTSAQEAFYAEVCEIAARARAEILPYFRTHRLDFTAGNGAWSISKPAADDDPYKPENHVSDDELPANIRALLGLEITRGDYLGFYIEDIKRGE